MRVITVSTKGTIRKGIKRLGRIHNFKETFSRKTLEEWGKEFEKQTRKSAFDAGLNPFTSDNFTNTIYWDQSPNSNYGALWMPGYMIALDNNSGKLPRKMKVTKKHTKFLHWAKNQSKHLRQKAIAVEEREIRGFTVNLQPYPFIQRGFSRARRKVKRITKEKSRGFKNV